MPAEVSFPFPSFRGEQGGGQGIVIPSEQHNCGNVPCNNSYSRADHSY